MDFSFAQLSGISENYSDFDKSIYYLSEILEEKTMKPRLEVEVDFKNVLRIRGWKTIEVGIPWPS